MNKFTEIRFYTLPPDEYVDYPYILVNIFNYKKLRHFKFTHAILDSGVNRIFLNWRKRDYPTWVLNKIKYLAKQLTEIYGDKIWVSIPDIPDDYYPGYVGDNVERTLKNIELFISIDGVNWLPVVQSRYLDIISFLESCHRLKNLIGVYQRVAIGTVCKTKDLNFITKCCKIARKFFPKSHIHAFGLTLNALPRVKEYINSWDSLAWTFPRKQGLPSCKNKQERIRYFNAYLERIKEIWENG